MSYFFTGDEILQDDIEGESGDNKQKDRQSENDIPDLPNLDEKNMDIDSILSDGKSSEPSRGKTNNVVSDQVRHKPGCSATEIV